MRKSIIVSLGLLAMSAVIFAGCATGGGKSDQDLIKESLNAFKAGMEAKNVDQLMGVVSDSFSHYEWGNKESLKGFISDVMKQGDLDDAKVTLDKAEIKIEGAEATVYPVELVAAFGSATIEFKMKKEADGVWRTTGLEMEGI